MSNLPPDGSDPRRAYSRLHVGIDGTLETLEGRQAVRVVDLSPSGAHLVLSQPAKIREGVLRWLNFDNFGMTMWQDDEDVGLKFDRLLPEHILDETRARAPGLVLELAQAWVAGSLHDD